MKGETLILHNVLLDGRAVDVSISNGLITEVTTSQEQSGTSVIQDGVSLFRFHSSLSVFPGLCNMHSHAPMTLFRGLGDDQPLDVWLKEYIWPAEQKLTDELVYKGTLQACREMLASGTPPHKRGDELPYVCVMAKDVCLRLTHIE